MRGASKLDSSVEALYATIMERMIITLVVLWTKVRTNAKHSPISNFEPKTSHFK
jgi:hypothetical protein